MFISDAVAQTDFLVEKAATGEWKPFLAIVIIVCALVCLGCVAITIYVVIKKFQDGDIVKKEIHTMNNSLQKILGKLEYEVLHNGKDIARLERRIEDMHEFLSAPQGLFHRVSRLEGLHLYKDMEKEFNSKN